MVASDYEVLLAFDPVVIAIGLVELLPVAIRGQVAGDDGKVGIYVVDFRNSASTRSSSKRASPQWMSENWAMV